MTHWIQQSDNIWSGWVSAGQSVSHRHRERESSRRWSSSSWDHQWQDWQDKEWWDQHQRWQRHDLQTLLAQGNLCKDVNYKIVVIVVIDWTSICSLEIFLAVSRPDSGNCHEPDGRCTDNSSPGAHTRTFSRCARSHVTARVAQGMMSLCECSQKSFFHRSCRFFGVPPTPFPLVFSSPSPHRQPSDLSSAINWNQTKPLCYSARGLAGPIPNAGYKPKFCIDVDSEHTPINLPSRNMSFQQEYDATIAASEDLNLPRHSVASSSSQHSAASTVPTLSKLGSVGTNSRKLVAEYGAVVSRTCIKETFADMDRETVVPSFFDSVSKEKRDRDQNVVQSFRDRQHLHKFLERKAELVVKGEKNWLSKDYTKLKQTWRETLGKRDSDVALYEINQEFESQRLQKRQINGLIRLKEIK